jgi:hypothetical protein
MEVLVALFPSAKSRMFAEGFASGAQNRHSDSRIGVLSEKVVRVKADVAAGAGDGWNSCRNAETLNRSDFSAQVDELVALGLIPQGGIHPALRDQVFGNGVVIMSEFAEVKLNSRSTGGMERLTT